MKSINLFYIVVISVGIVLIIILRPDFHRDISFYGFAESNETEINYNYPVVVERIMVKPGQKVVTNDTLLLLTRRKSKETLEDQHFKIAQLEAEESVWHHNMEAELTELELSKQMEILEINTKIDQVKKELDYKRSLIENLESIKPSATDYKPLEDEIENLEKIKSELINNFTHKSESLKKELDLGKNPYRRQIEHLRAEKLFEEEQKVLEIVVTAPADGLIGNISCKEEEHVSSFSTLLTFYEPHSSLIKGYVHEDLQLEVNIGDRFIISSLTNEDVKYEGSVIGLGSRIVEIPVRLRKIAAIKSYGREVLIEIPVENHFLQKEKVSINYSSNNG